MDCILPNEIWDKIFSHITKAGDIYNIRLTCSLFNILIPHAIRAIYHSSKRKIVLNSSKLLQYPNCESSNIVVHCDNQNHFSQLIKFKKLNIKYNNTFVINWVNYWSVSEMTQSKFNLINHTFYNSRKKKKKKIEYSPIFRCRNGIFKIYQDHDAIKIVDKLSAKYEIILSIYDTNIINFPNIIGLEASSYYYNNKGYFALSQENIRILKCPLNDICDPKIMNYYLSIFSQSNIVRYEKNIIHLPIYPEDVDLLLTVFPNTKELMIYSSINKQLPQRNGVSIIGYDPNYQRLFK